MSSVSTETEFTSSLKKDENIYLTKDRQFLYFNDLQGGNYNNNSSEVRLNWYLWLTQTNLWIGVNLLWWSLSSLVFPDSMEPELLED